MADKKTEKKDATVRAAKQEPKPGRDPQGSNRDPKPAKKGEAKAIPIDKLNASNDE